VHRRIDARDRRVARVAITSHGRRLLAESRSRKTAYLEQQLAALSADERATLAQAATILERVLEREPS
jgi:DNA-binding MarR family transcriptional regulator